MERAAVRVARESVLKQIVSRERYALRSLL
jgi:hypothetical protein